MIRISLEGCTSYLVIGILEKIVRDCRHVVGGGQDCEHTTRVTNQYFYICAFYSPLKNYLCHSKVHYKRSLKKKLKETESTEKRKIV